MSTLPQYQCCPPHGPRPTVVPAAPRCLIPGLTTTTPGFHWLPPPGTSGFHLHDTMHRFTHPKSQAEASCSLHANFTIFLIAKRASGGYSLTSCSHSKNQFQPQPPVLQTVEWLKPGESMVHTLTPVWRQSMGFHTLSSAVKKIHFAHRFTLGISVIAFYQS